MHLCCREMRNHWQFPSRPHSDVSARLGRNERMPQAGDQLSVFITQVCQPQGSAVVQGDFFNEWWRQLLVIWQQHVTRCTVSVLMPCSLLKCQWHLLQTPLNFSVMFSLFLHWFSVLYKRWNSYVCSRHYQYWDAIHILVCSCLSCVSCICICVTCK